MRERTDEEIAAAVQNGNTESFGILVERFEAKMRRYARKFVYNFHDIEDLVQEVFIKAYVNIRSFDAKRRFSPWLYRIAHNEYINAIKKKGKEPMPFFDPDALFPHPIAKEATDENVNREEMRRMLDRGLDRLNPKYREPLVLYYFEEMSYQEIADILQLPMSTIGVRLNRAKSNLEKILNKHGQRK